MLHAPSRSIAARSPAGRRVFRPTISISPTSASASPIFSGSRTGRPRPSRSIAPRSPPGKKCWRRKTRGSPRRSRGLAGRSRCSTGLPKRSSPYRRALAIREQANGAGSDAAAEDITRLGIVLMRLDRPADAEPLFRRMLAMREAAQGADGEGVAEALRWIANAAERQDRNAEAEILHKRALAISEKTIWTRRPVDRPRPLVAGASLCGAATRRGGRTVAGACCRHSGSDRRRQ